MMLTRRYDDYSFVVKVEGREYATGNEFNLTLSDGFAQSNYIES